MEIKPMDIIFYKGDSLISKIIKKVTKSEYSHMAIIVDNLHIIETDWKFPVSINHLSYSTLSYDVYRCAELNEGQRREMLNFLRDELQKKYDWTFLFSRWLHIMFGTRIRNNTEKYNCDELVFAAYKHVGILLTDEELITTEVISKSKCLTKLN